MRSTKGRRCILFLLSLALIPALLLSAVRASEEDPAGSLSEAAELAAETDAVIAALKNITLRSEDQILAARAMYDALSEEAKAMVTNRDLLEKAEEKFWSLKDRDVVSRTKKLTDAGKHDEAIALAEDYLSGRGTGENGGQVMVQLLRACARKAGSMIRAGEYEQADRYLQECRERYAGEDLSAVDSAERSLERAIAEPESGSLLVSRAKGEYGTVTIRTGDAPALVKLVSLSDPDRCLTVYVRAGESAAVRIGAGTYGLRYATGIRWYGEKELFGSSTRCLSVDTVLRFSTDRTGSDVYYQNYEIVLQSADDQARGTTPVEIGEF